MIHPAAADVTEVHFKCPPVRGKSEVEGLVGTPVSTANIGGQSECPPESVLNPVVYLQGERCP